MQNFIEHIGQLFGITAVRYLILAGIPFLLFYIVFPVRFARNKIQQRAARRKDLLREIRHSMVTSLIFAGCW